MLQANANSYIGIRTHFSLDCETEDRVWVSDWIRVRFASFAKDSTRWILLLKSIASPNPTLFVVPKPGIVGWIASKAFAALLRRLVMRALWRFFCDMLFQESDSLYKAQSIGSDRKYCLISRHLCLDVVRRDWPSDTAQLTLGNHAICEVIRDIFLDSISRTTVTGKIRGKRDNGIGGLLCV